uniref:Uncharacterized protein n=1 Tax=Candidatus Kentrum sp. TC TaxID=2126339 RepID=A0A450Z8U6_9GAMM|nr:MAG: hypothetical protein BECKTC1821D_GA0114238_109416 [Candidatus Kentron sp. TC]
MIQKFIENKITRAIKTKIMGHKRTSGVVLIVFVVCALYLGFDSSEILELLKDAG